MLDMKKKLSSFIPTSARAQLQNVLTVEWDTHKTVLVEVPGANQRSSEMEMSGFDRANGDTSNYGRLADDDEETEGLFNRSNLGNSRSDWKPSSSARGSGSNSSGSGSGSKSKKRPPPLAPRPDEMSLGDNPFDETSPSYLASVSNAPSHSYSSEGRSQSDRHAYDHNRMSGGMGRPQRSSTTWATFEDDRGGVYRDNGASRGTRQLDGPGNPWGGGSSQWGQTVVASPSSSRGTRESDSQEAENPFR